MDKEEFLQAIENFLAEHAVSASEFGREVVGNPNFVFKLRKGSYNPRIDTMSKVLDAMKSV